MHRLRHRIESNSVRHLIPVFYTPWLLWAILATFWLPPVTIIQQAMGHSTYVFWLWLTIPGTLAPMVGLWLRDGGTDIEDMNSPILRKDWWGLALQWGGHSCMAVLLLLFEISAVKGALAYDGPSSYAGMTIFAAFVLSSYNFGLFMLALQILFKLIRAEELKKFSEQGRAIYQ